MDYTQKGEGGQGGMPVADQELYRSAGRIHLCARRLVAVKAAELGATPFDIEGCEIGHHGEDVSFNSIPKKHRLTDPALVLLGEIVRAADSHPSNPTFRNSSRRLIFIFQKAGHVSNCYWIGFSTRAKSMFWESSLATGSGEVCKAAM